MPPDTPRCRSRDSLLDALEFDDHYAACISPASYALLGCRGSEAAAAGLNCRATSWRTPRTRPVRKWNDRIDQ